MDRRQVSAAADYQQQPQQFNQNPRNPMATQGGSVRNPPSSLHGSQGLERAPTVPIPGSSGNGAGGRHQPSMGNRQQLTRQDTPAFPASSGKPQLRRPENRVLPIGGPGHMSHRASVVDVQSPQRPSSGVTQRGSLKRQPEIDEGVEHHVPNRFSGDFNDQHRNSGDFGSHHQQVSNRHSGDFGHHQHPQESRSRPHSTHGHHPQQHHHEPLGARNSTDSSHLRRDSSQDHTKHHHQQHHRQSNPHILVTKHVAEKYQKQYLEDERLKRERELKIEEIKREIRKEKRVLLTFSAVSIFFGILWLISVCLSFWYFVYADEGSLADISTYGISPKTKVDTKNNTKDAVNAVVKAVERVPDVFVSSHTGLWRTCRTKRYVESGNEITYCFWINMFPTDDELKKAYTDEQIIAFQRTAACFAVISLMVMAMTVPAAISNVQSTRYMYRRLAAGLYFLSAATVFVVVEVVISKIDYAEENKRYLHPKNSHVRYGFCFIVGWMTFAVFLITSLAYLAYSRKRKGDNALDDDDEQEFLTR